MFPLCVCLDSQNLTTTPGRGPSFGPDNTPWATVSENRGVAHFTIGASHQVPLVVAATGPQPLPSHILVVAPHMRPPTDIGIRREMLIFAPLLGDPWHCTANAPAMPGFPAYPKTFAIAFTPFGGNTLSRVMTGDRLFIRTLYGSNAGRVVTVTERYIHPSATRFIIATAFNDGQRHEGTISCKRAPTPFVPAIYEP